MVGIRSHLESRSFTYIRKYRIFFIFGAVLLCAQVYLAYSFFTLESENFKQTSTYTREKGFVQGDDGKGLPKGTRQFKLPPDKHSNPSKAYQSNRNRTTRVKLDTSLLNFTPACEVSSKEAVSAVTRAQSQECKKLIIDITCLSQQNLLYPANLSSSCPHSLGFPKTPKSFGCFKDNKTSRLLASYYVVFKSNNSPENCINICLQSGYPYAGVEYSVECFCGVEEPLRAMQLPDSSCNMKCPSNSKQSCGGYLTINVFPTGIKRFKPQEARNASLSYENEEPVRIAYLLTVNGRASRQVKRLLNILYHPSHLFYIHVDVRQDYMYQEMLEVERNCKTKNIIVARGEQRHASIWGGASLLTTLLDSARQMLAHSQHWDFLINLSESDFPVKSNTRLVEFLSWNRGFNFVKSHGREVQRFVTKQGLDKTFIECEARMWRIGDRKLPNGIQIDGGSDWVALSRNFVEYVADPQPDALIQGLLTVFRYTLLPAESFFHTALRNSRFCDTYIDNNLHVTNWKRKLGCKCQYKAVVDWCGCSPNDFKLEAFGRIRNTAERNLFFARKFEPVIDQRIIDKVEQWLYPERLNSMLTAKGYDAYWQSLYRHNDTSPLPDDALVTVSVSLARLAYRKLGAERSELLEVSAYFRENRFVGILVRAKTKMNGLESSTLQNEFSEEIEALVYIKRNLSISKPWLGKIISFTVNTDYDQKEQTFRNLLESIGPFASPVLAYEFSEELTLPQNITFLWFDPQNRLMDVSSLQLDESTLIGVVKPQLSSQLNVGMWRVFMISDSKVSASTNFLVTALAYWKNQRITPEKAQQVNGGGPSNAYHIPKEIEEKWTKIVTAWSETSREPTHSETRERVGWQLDRWVDSFVSEFYEISKICYIAKSVKLEMKLPKCWVTNWSSMSPDLKSDIRSTCQN